MASLCNLSLLHPAAIPAKKSLAAGAILSQPLAILRIPPLFCAARFTSVIPKATQSQKYVYPDPIPEFAADETKKFKAGLLKKLSKEKETFGNDLQMVVEVCAEIFDEFLRKDYGGPGTLLIEPFTDMMLAVKEKNLAGAPLAARASLLWAQNNVDRDWEDWNSKSHKRVTVRLVDNAMGDDSGYSNFLLLKNCTSQEIVSTSIVTFSYTKELLLHCFPNSRFSRLAENFSIIFSFRTRKCLLETASMI